MALGVKHIPKVDSQAIYFLNKLEKKGPYDIVLIGDSRVAVGLNPIKFEQADPGAKCLNFGFFGLGYSISFLQRVNELLGPKPHNAVVVLAINGASLTPLTADSNGFTAVDRMTYVERSQFRIVGPHWMAPDPFFLPHQYLPNGWVPIEGTTRDPMEAVIDYERVFNNARCSESILRVVCSQVTAWRKRGIHVLALRMPTTYAMFKLEQDLMGYRPRKYQDMLVAAGANWLDLPNVDLDSYDGSHLDVHAAERVSTEIAGAAARLAKS